MQSEPVRLLADTGDTGYFPGFRDIGAEHGPFDATMIQIGAYSEYWPDIHMTPAEGMRAHLDLQGGEPAGVMLPIHWGTFNLAPHPWAEPVEGTVAAAAGAGARVALPRPGEPFLPVAGPLPADPWWRALAGEPAEGLPAVPDHGRPLGAAVSHAVGTAGDADRDKSSGPGSQVAPAG